MIGFLKCHCQEFHLYLKADSAALPRQYLVTILMIQMMKLGTREVQRHSPRCRTQQSELNLACVSYLGPPPTFIIVIFILRD